ncbi:hypothetical protein AXX12_00195 [Anaerosporomusa subterranea]|uniref:HTH lacI-type domain-containing protein n=1 Tax=Anaerosporomusa subterranea TaxID=1794912 RepID=A0A154BVN4_ANASB|nr:LacI family DNA-binding transcriptional regulator [Anaerosporomusa subterranea]KYZ78001.1 hypothetical protein AXX12_00195 [Anaerosporomusa subterranea]
MEKRSYSERQGKVTIREVAEKAETSIATVSYVLNHEANRYLRPELRDRVLQAASELGYVKNAAASSLKGKRRGILAVLVPQFGNIFFTRICVNVEAVARQEGCIVTICNSDDDPAQERLILDRLVAQRIDGCIISPVLLQAENLALLERHQVPFVILERSLDETYPAYDFVGHDNFQSGYLATQRLLSSGHKNIAFLGWDSPVPNVWERLDGYTTALREYGLSFRPEWVKMTELSKQAGRDAAAQLPLTDITAIVLGHHESANGALLHFQDAGLRWPEQISIVMIGTPEWSGMLRPRLTCIKRPESEMGSAAATLLFEKLRDPNHVATRRIFSCSLLEGGSVRNIL